NPFRFNKPLAFQRSTRLTLRSGQMWLEVMRSGRFWTKSGANRWTAPIDRASLDRRQGPPETHFGVPGVVRVCGNQELLCHDSGFTNSPSLPPGGVAAQRKSVRERGRKRGGGREDGVHREGAWRAGRYGRVGTVAVARKASGSFESGTPARLARDAQRT